MKDKVLQLCFGFCTRYKTFNFAFPINPIGVNCFPNYSDLQEVKKIYLCLVIKNKRIRIRAKMLWIFSIIAEMSRASYELKKVKPER